MRSLLLLAILSGCTSLKLQDGQTGALVGQAGSSGAMGLINGKTHGCAIVMTADSQMRITKLEFDAETNKCVAGVISE